MDQLTAAMLRPRQAPQLKPTVRWWSAVLLALGAALLVNVSLGPMAASIGNASLLVWLGSALIGGVQCLLLAELATHLPHRVGGTATYAQAFLADSAPLLGALSSWSYWFAWTPGIAVNLILAAEYLQATVLPGISTLPLAVLLIALLYGVNALGLRASSRVFAIVAAVAVIPLIVSLAALAFRPELLDAARLWPMAVPGHSWSEPSAWLLLIKWAFVGAWAAYGGEMASTVVAEMHHGARHALRTMVTSGAIAFAAFGGIPFLLVMLVGAEGLTREPRAVLLPAAELVFGEAGATVIGLMLAAGLILGAQAFIVGSSRTIFQMTMDRHIPRQFSKINRWGAPIGSLFWDILVITGLLLVFGFDIEDIVASANVGYVLVFILMPVAYLLRRRRAPAAPAGLVLPRVFDLVAVGLAVFNAVLLTVGGLQWGLKVFLIGVIVAALAIPLSLLSRLQDARLARAAVPAAGDDGAP